MASGTNPLELMARRLELHALLTPDDRNALIALPFTTRRFAAGTFLVREGEAPTQCAVLISGYAYRQKLTEDGARQILSLHLPGEPLDFQHLFLDEADHSLQTLTEADVGSILRADLRELARSCESVGHAILVYLLVEGSIFREWIVNVGRRSARARMAHLLCEFAVRCDLQGLAVDGRYQLPMTQEQLGDALGLTSVHVNRTVRALEKDGLVTRDKHDISFPKWDALRQVGGFNERYLHFWKQAA